jgi:hypothetical protein
MRKFLVLAALVAVILAALGSSANAASFEPRFEFDCGAAGTFFSEVLFVPSPLPAPFAPPPEATVRLFTTESGETNAVFILLQVTGAFTNPGLEANLANPNLVTCTIIRPNGETFEAIGLLTPAP